MDVIESTENVSAADYLTLVADLIAPRLVSQADRCRLQAVCRSLRESGIASKVMNCKINAVVTTADALQSFEFWLIPRATLFVEDLELQFPNVFENEDIRTLPREIGLLAGLKKLNVTTSGWMESLPTEMSELRNLTELRLSGCQETFSLPEELSTLTSLQKLCIVEGRFTSLPPVVFQLHALKELYVKNCGSLESMPDALGQLTALRILSIVECERINWLPPSIRQCMMLRELDLSSCRDFTSLPAEITQLTALRTLRLEYLYKLKFRSLLPGMSELSLLEELDLRSTYLGARFEDFLQLQKLQILRWDNICESNQKLPLDCLISSLTNLKELQMNSYSSLEYLPSSIGQLSALEILSLGPSGFEGPCKLREIPPEISRLTALKELKIYSYGLLTVAREVGLLTSLHTLDFNECDKLESFPCDLSEMKLLTRLDLGSCPRLQCLPAGLGQLTALEELALKGCTRLHTLHADIGNMVALKRLYLRSCEQLKTLPDSIGQCSQLQTLDLRKCKRLEKLPDSVGQLESLESFALCGCLALRSLPEEIGRLSTLSRLDLRKCINLESLPLSISELTSLELLFLGGCSSLTSWPQTCHAENYHDELGRLYTLANDDYYHRNYYIHDYLDDFTSADSPHVFPHPGYNFL